MTWWLDPGFLAFDTETTGVDATADRIVTAAVVTFKNAKPIEVTSWHVKVDVPIPQASSDIHGITDAISQRDGMDERTALIEMRDHLDQGLPVVAFNSIFDIAMLNGNLRRLGETEASVDSVICPMILDRQLNKYVRGSNQRRLAPTAARYGLEFRDEDWHGAEPDAAMAGEVFLAEISAYPELEKYSAYELAAKVADWRQEQDAEFRAWLASRNN